MVQNLLYRPLLQPLGSQSLTRQPCLYKSTMSTQVTPYSISRSFGIQIDDIRDQSGKCPDPWGLASGQLLFVPWQGQAQSIYVYNVRREDTLERIADKFNTSVQAVQLANRSLKDAYCIVPGQKILVPYPTTSCARSLFCWYKSAGACETPAEPLLYVCSAFLPLKDAPQDKGASHFARPYFLRKRR